MCIEFKKIICIIYKINVNEIYPIYYTQSLVGRTKIKLKERIKEHQADVRHSYPNSKIYQHKRNCDHSMNFKEAKVFYHCNRIEQRLFLEAWASY